MGDDVMFWEEDGATKSVLEQRRAKSVHVGYGFVTCHTLQECKIVSLRAISVLT